MLTRLVGTLGAIGAALLMSIFMPGTALQWCSIGLFCGLALAGLHSTLNMNAILVALGGGTVTGLAALAFAALIQPSAIANQNELAQIYLCGAFIGLGYWGLAYACLTRPGKYRPGHTDAPFPVRLAEALKLGQEDAQEAKARREADEVAELALQEAEARSRANDVLGRSVNLVRETITDLVARGVEHRVIDLMCLNRFESEQKVEAGIEPDPSKLRFAAKLVWDELVSTGLSPSLILRRDKLTSGPDRVYGPRYLCIQLRVCTSMLDQNSASH